MQKKKAVLYCRFSTKDQIHGDSLTRQNFAAQQWCERNNAELIDQYQDLGVSGWKKITRPMFEELCRALEEGRIPPSTSILLESTDRLSRRGWQYTLSLITNLISSYDCEIVIMDKQQTFNRTNINSLFDCLPLMLNAEMAEKESTRKSELVQAAYKRKRESGDINKYPYWLTKNEDKSFSFNENKKVIDKIIEWRLQGFGANKITILLNKEGIPSPRGKVWGVSSVVTMIRNTALYGNKDFKNKSNDVIQSTANAFPKIIDYTTWKLIQVEGEKAGRKAQETPFANMIRCVCGGSMSLMTGGRGEKYRACRLSQDGSGCDQKRIRNFDEILKEGLCSLTYESTSHRVSILPELNERLTKLEKVKKILIDSGDIDSLTDLYKDISEIKNQIAIENTMVDLPKVEMKTVFTGTIDEQRIALKRVVENITVSRVGNYANISVMLTNGHRKGFGVNIGVGRHNSGKNTIVFGSDSERLLKEMESLGVEDEV